MIKTKQPDGTFKIGQRASEAPEFQDVEIAQQGTSEKRQYTFVVGDLPLAATNTDGVNKLIQNLFLEGYIDPMNVSNGTHTFKQLHEEIMKLREELSRAERRVDQLLKLNSNE